MKKLAAPLAATALLAGALAAAPATHADAATAVHYASCAKLAAKYPHGVRASAKTLNTVHHRNGSVTRERSRATVDAKVYRANSKLDADRDGIACER